MLTIYSKALTDFYRVAELANLDCVQTAKLRDLVMDTVRQTYAQGNRDGIKWLRKNVK